MSKKPLEMPPHGNTVYPWELWQNGETYRVKHGRHFHVSAASFRGGLQKRASDLGLRVTTRVDGDVVIFRFSTREEGTPCAATPTPTPTPPPASAEPTSTPKSRGAAIAKRKSPLGTKASN